MKDHGACVEALLGDFPTERLFSVFEAAFNAIWQRALISLGNVTLSAIVDRVLYNAAEQHPLLSALKLLRDGVDCRELSRKIGPLEQEPLAPSLRFVLVELLTVIGRLTAELLTPAMHEALSALGAADRRLHHAEPTESERNDDT